VEEYKTLDILLEKLEEVLVKEIGTVDREGKSLWEYKFDVNDDWVDIRLQVPFPVDNIKVMKCKRPF
tara:strand:- start:480 stop:680 length:201 start_codon:yes stop_codon:yes gene_type:complete